MSNIQKPEPESEFEIVPEFDSVPQPEPKPEPESDFEIVSDFDSVPQINPEPVKNTGSGAMKFNSYHVGGGGNCVFFSTAKQLNEKIHQSVRDELDRLSKDPASQQDLKDRAKNLIDNQFNAGFMNTSLNRELHDYRFRGPEAGGEIIDKIISKEKANSDMNNVLALRLLMDVKRSQNDYTGEKSLYTPIAGTFPPDLLEVLHEIVPENTKLPTILSVSQLSMPGQKHDYHVMQVCKIGDNGKAVYEKENYDHLPNPSEIQEYLGKIGSDGKNVMGLIGQGKHCKAYVGSGIEAGDCLNIVSGESRKSIGQFISGFFVNIGQFIKSKFTGSSSGSTAPSVTVPEKDDSKIEIEQSEKGEEKGRENTKSIQKQMSDDFELVGDEFNNDVPKKKNDEFELVGEEMNYDKFRETELGTKTAKEAPPVTKKEPDPAVKEKVPEKGNP